MTPGTPDAQKVMTELNEQPRHNVVGAAQPTTGPIWIKLTGNQLDGDNHWRYGFIQQTLTPSGWQTKPGGLTGSESASDYAENSGEALNSGSGIQGSGVDQANIDAVNQNGGTFALVPMGPGPWPAWVVPIDGATSEPFFRVQIALPNTPDGTCSS